MTDWRRVVGWAVPLVCMAVVGGAIYVQHGNLQRAQDELGRAQEEARQALAANEEAARHGGEVRFAAQPTDRNEEAEFLEVLRKRAAETGVKIKAWTAQLTPPPPTGQSEAESADPKAQKLKGLVSLRSELTVEGAYGNVRTFIAGLEQTKRLYTFNEIRWTKTRIGTELKATITRYVETGAPAAPIGTQEKS
jgi:hypothetical protein